MFGVGFFLAVATFEQFAGFRYSKPVALWIIYFIWPAICAAIYIISQLILVIRTLDDRWPIGDIVFGTAFFAVAQVVLFGFSVEICDAVKHYIDGLFFFTVCMLLSVMMVYKYWDSITKEDLEFSVGSKAAVWEVKEPMMGGEQHWEDDGVSNYNGGGASLVGGGQYYQQQGPGFGYPPPQGFADRERY